MTHQGLFATKNGIPIAVHKEVEAAFLAASKDKSKINSLAETLQKHNLFKHYEERFFALVKSSK
jgi:hypothetical protein